MKDEMIATLTKYNEDQAKRQKTPPKTIDPALKEEQIIQRKTAVQYWKETEMKKYISELEERNRKLQADNEHLRALEHENQHYVYPRGEISTELELLRKEKISNLVEINRLEKERYHLYL